MSHDIQFALYCILWDSSAIFDACIISTLLYSAHFMSSTGERIALEAIEGISPLRTSLGTPTFPSRLTQRSLRHEIERPTSWSGAGWYLVFQASDSVDLLE